MSDDSGVQLYPVYGAPADCMPKPRTYTKVQGRYMAAVAAAHHVDTHEASHLAATTLSGLARGFLAENKHTKGWETGSAANARISDPEAGDFTDYYVYLEVPGHANFKGARRSGLARLNERDRAEYDAEAAAASIEFGRRAYTRPNGQRIGATMGTRPLHRAIAAMGG